MFPTSSNCLSKNIMCSVSPSSIVHIYIVLTVILTCLNHEVNGHGRLIEPPSRSSMWRYGFNTTANYNDHELYCGGFATQYKMNKGRCGVCGDAYNLASPRPNEAGGIYGQGIIVRKYQANSIIRIKVELTANHKGYFEFRLCPNNNPKKVVSQKCLDTYLLNQSNGEGPRYYPGEGTKVFESRFLLPRNLTCTQCVIQWRYIAGNNWGTCPDGTQAVGCGPQEEFRACSDVVIADRSGHASSEVDISDDENEIDTDKLEGNVSIKTEDNVDEANSEQSIWPFIMVLLGLILAGLGFGIVFGWFYRKEVIEFARNTLTKNHWKHGDPNSHNRGGGLNKRYMGSELPSPRNLNPTIIDCYSDPIYTTINHHNPNVGGILHGPPVPPPRNKHHQKTSTTDLHLVANHTNNFKIENDYHEYHYPKNNIHINNNSSRLNRSITPDIISKPLSVTINGVAV